MEPHRTFLPSDLNNLVKRMDEAEKAKWHREVAILAAVIISCLALTFIVLWVASPPGWEWTKRHFCCGKRRDGAGKWPSSRSPDDHDLSRMEAGLRPAPRAVVNDRVGRGNVYVGAAASRQPEMRGRSPRRPKFVVTPVQEERADRLPSRYSNRESSQQ